MTTSTCTQCGTSVPPDARQCPKCGQSAGSRPRSTGHYRFSAGDVIDGRYEVVERIPGGGMGELYRARHLHLHDDRVIKLLRSDQLSDETQRKRFLQEARIAASIKHPNVGTLHDCASLPDGTYYMVEEYIDGTTVARSIRQGRRFTLHEIVSIAHQVLSGLVAIHEKGIIHRDISPDNVMLSQGAAGPIVKIIDLGIAKPIVAGEGQALTSAGLFIGKPHYASPEQMRMIEVDSPVDNRTDLYSLGVVLFEMIVGKVPFEAATPLAYLLKQISEEVRTVNRDVSNLVPPELDEFIVKLLKSRREERFSSASDALAAVDAIRDRLFPAQKPASVSARTEAGVFPAGPVSTGKRPGTDEIPFEQLEAMVRADRTEPGQASPHSPRAALGDSELESEPTEVQPYESLYAATQQTPMPQPPSTPQAYPVPARTAPGAPPPVRPPASQSPPTLVDPKTFSGSAAVNEPVKSPAARLWAVAIPVFLVVVGLGGYLFYRVLDRFLGQAQTETATVTQTETAQQAPVEPAPTPAPQPQASQPGPQPAPATTTHAVAPTTTHAVTPIVPPPVAATQKPKPEPKPAKQQVQAATATAEPPVQQPAPAPAVATAAPAPEPAQEEPAPVREGEIVPPGPGVLEPQIVNQVVPIFPPATQGLSARGATIMLSVLVGPEGNVEIVKVIKSCGYTGYDKLAEDAARKTKYTPPRKDGVPVRVWRTMRFAIK